MRALRMVGAIGVSAMKRKCSAKNFGVHNHDRWKSRRHLSTGVANRPMSRITSDEKTNENQGGKTGGKTGVRSSIVADAIERP